MSDIHRKTGIFISHSWHNEERYQAIKTMLDADPSFGWENFSLEWTQAIQTSQDVYAKLEQELKYQRERAAILARQIQDLENLERDLSVQADPIVARKYLSAELSARLEAVSQSSIYLALQYQIRREYEARFRQLESQLADRDEAMAQLELQSLRERTEHFKKELAHCERRQEILARDMGKRRYFHRTASARDILYSTDKVRSDTVSSYPEISLVLSNRIIAADIFILIVEVFGQYRQWMEFELGVATSSLRPTIPVLPIDEPHCPPEVARRCDVVLKWEGDALRNAIRSITQGRPGRNRSYP
jgi:hypothetical protein